MRDKKSYLLSLLIILSAFVCSVVGDYWNAQYYHDQNAYTLSAPALAKAMQGVHDKLYITDIFSLNAAFAVSNLSTNSASDLNDTDLSADAKLLSERKHTSGTSSFVSGSANAQSQPAEDESYHFTTATDDYFADACFIGASFADAFCKNEFVAKNKTIPTIAIAPILKSKTQIIKVIIIVFKIPCVVIITTRVATFPSCSIRLVVTEVIAPKLF